MQWHGWLSGCLVLGLSGCWMISRLGRILEWMGLSGTLGTSHSPVCNSPLAIGTWDSISIDIKRSCRSLSWRGDNSHYLERNLCEIAWEPLLLFLWQLIGKIVLDLHTMNFIGCFICAILSANNVHRHTKWETTTPSPDVICEVKLDFCSIVGEIKLYLSVDYQRLT